MEKYDIFISYRREGGYDTAKHLFDLLTRDGYRVSFDIDTLRNGDFDKTLLLRIDQCRDFIIIVDKNCFERTMDSSFNPKHDWLRQELSYALKKQKNIIPIFLRGINSFPSGLPNDLQGVAQKNGPLYNRYYFNDFYRRLKTDFLTSKPKRNDKLWILSLVVLLGIAGIVIVSIYMFKSISHRDDEEQRNNLILQNDSEYLSSKESSFIEAEEHVSDSLEVTPFHPFMRFFGPDIFTIGGRIMMEADESPIEIQIRFNSNGDEVIGGYIKFLDDSSEQLIISSGYQNPREETGLVLKGHASYCTDVRVEISYVGEGCYEGIIDLCGVQLQFKAE